MKCLICEREVAVEECRIILLSSSEKALLGEASDSYVYCHPCWGVLSDPIQGPALMKGLAQQRMRLIGVSSAVAEAKAATYHQKLTDLIFSAKRKS